MKRVRKLIGGRQEMMRKLLFLAVLVALLSGSFSRGGDLEKRIPTPAPEKVGLPPGELVRIRDFSVAISKVHRKEREAVLHFALTKVVDTNAGPQILPVILIDDHKNEYEGKLRIDLGGADILNAIPKGFTYVKVLIISMPKRAPIEKLKLGKKERDFARIRFGEPRFLENFGNSAVVKGEKVRVGEWLSFTMGQIEPRPRRWKLPIEVENKEYNPLRAEIKVGVQYEDGTISWANPYGINVPATSKSVAKPSLPIPGWVKRGPPQPRVLLLAYIGEKAKNIELRMHAVTRDDLPPLVGQGPRRQEDTFVAAYERNGGRKMMGDPLSLPRWFAGGSRPKDKSDVLIQEFSSVSKFGKSAIIWDKQAGASKAYVINGPVRDKYVSRGGPYFTSEPDGSLLLAPIGDTIAIKATESQFKTHGLYGEFKGGAIASMRNRIAVAVTGKVFAKWKEKGLTKGLLGFPTGDMRRAPSSGAQGFNTTGLTQQFEGGQVFWHVSGPSSGLATTVLGERLLKAYEQTGGTSGWLGFPVGEKSKGQDVRELFFWFQDPLEFIEFEGGILVRWDRKNPTETWKAYVNRYPEGKYIIEGHTKRKMNYSQMWNGWLKRGGESEVNGIFQLDSALVTGDTITINVSATFEKVKRFFSDETTARIRGVLFEHYGWRKVTRYKPIAVAGLFAAKPLVGLKMNVPYSGSFTFELPQKGGLLRFYVPWPNAVLVGPMTFALLPTSGKDVVPPITPVEKIKQPIPKSKSPLTEGSAGIKLKVTTTVAFIKAIPSIGGKTLARVPLNTILDAESTQGKWYKVSWLGISGFIYYTTVEEIK